MSDEQVVIREVSSADAGAVAAIYNHYVLHTVVTFEEAVVAAGEMARRIQEVAAASLPWLVVERVGSVVGYAYASRWKGRSGYRFTAEVTVYLDPAHVGLGLGGRLYGELLPRLQELGLHAVIGGIALPNEASVKLHERFGMRKVAHFPEQGRKFGRWIDVGYWQRLL